MLRTAILLFAFLTAVSFHCPGQRSGCSTLSLIFAGDIMGHDDQIRAALDPETQTYNYEPVFRYVRPFIKQADIAIGNLEVTLAGAPYSGYPQFSSPDELARAASAAGFDVMIQANNHALDGGKKGFIRTLTVLDTTCLLHTGTFYDSDDRARNYPLILEKNDIRIALLNYTYGTNGLVIPPPCIINRIDTTQIRMDLEKARLARPDFVVVTMHWGEEYQREENMQQQKLASFLFTHGADAIIGSHPHVIQPVRKYYPEPSDTSIYNIVVYSLGNFVSNQRAHYKDGGILFFMQLTKTSTGTILSGYNYMPSWVWRSDTSGKYAFHILPVDLYKANESFFNLPESDRNKINLFYEDTHEHLTGVPENNFFKNFKLDQSMNAGY
jgi:poly-gamma-glutamate capsule biosynthesis protein CapA/YwtB (metallophosphatase superfamily)